MCDLQRHWLVEEYNRYVVILVLIHNTVNEHQTCSKTKLTCLNITSVQNPKISIYSHTRQRSWQQIIRALVRTLFIVCVYQLLFKIKKKTDPTSYKWVIGEKKSHTWAAYSLQPCSPVCVRLSGGEAEKQYKKATLDRVRRRCWAPHQYFNRRVDTSKKK